MGAGATATTGGSGSTSSGTGVSSTGRSDRNTAGTGGSGTSTTGRTEPSTTTQNRGAQGSATANSTARAGANTTATSYVLVGGANQNLANYVGQRVEVRAHVSNPPLTHRRSIAHRTDGRQLIEPASDSSSHRQASVPRTDKRQLLAPTSVSPSHRQATAHRSVWQQLRFSESAFEPFPPDSRCGAQVRGRFEQPLLPTWFSTERARLIIDVGVKSAGFVPGEPLASGLVARAGIGLPLR